VQLIRQQSLPSQELQKQQALPKLQHRPWLWRMQLVLVRRLMHMRRDKLKR
jgi:hypothetical protein